MKALLLLAFLPGCAMFDPPPSSLCISGYCAHLQQKVDELNSPEMTKRLCAAGAMTPACWVPGERST